MGYFVWQCIALAVDLIISGFCNNLYQKKMQQIKAVETAPYLNIDSTLVSKVQLNGNSIPYAVISGTVKATFDTLQSKIVPGTRGVIQELITKDRKLLGFPLFGTWIKEEVLSRFQNWVPFALVGSGGWLKYPAHVEIAEPLLAEGLTLTPMKSERTFINFIWDLIFQDEKGETGIVETENMLAENTFLIGAGRLVLQEGSLKLQPPFPPLQDAFFLSPSSLELEKLKKHLLEELKKQAKLLNAISFSLAAVGISILLFIFLKSYWAFNSELENTQSQQADSKIRSHPTCVVCLTNPIEAVILDCGHACVCENCSLNIDPFCPMCRRRIQRMVSVYLP